MYAILFFNAVLLTLTHISPFDTKFRHQSGKYTSCRSGLAPSPSPHFTQPKRNVASLNPADRRSCEQGFYCEAESGWGREDQRNVAVRVPGEDHVSERVTGLGGLGCGVYRRNPAHQLGSNMSFLFVGLGRWRKRSPP
jgi:hypothetical protein